MGEDAALTVTDDDKWRLHKGCVHDDIVQIALSGFLCAWFDKHGIEIEPDIFRTVIKAFSLAMQNPEVINKSIEHVVQLQAQHEVEQAERRRHMH